MTEKYTQLLSATWNAERKTTRKEAWEILKGCAASTPGDDGSFTIGERDLWKLMTCLRPHLPKKPRTDLEWVAQARSRSVEEARYYLHHIHYNAERSRLEATNGFILFIVDDCPEYGGQWLSPEGDVLPLDLGSFPDVERVIPRNLEEGVEVNVRDLEIVEEGKLSLAKLTNGASFQVSALAMAAAPGERLIYRANKEAAGPALFRVPGYDNRRAIIMPKKA